MFNCYDVVEATMVKNIMLLIMTFFIFNYPSTGAC